MYSLVIHLQEEYDYTLTQEEEELYTLLFKEAGFTKHHFLLLMEGATIQHFEEGEYIHESLEPVDGLFFLLNGHCELMYPFSDDYPTVKARFALKQKDPAAFEATQTPG